MKVCVVGGGHGCYAAAAEMVERGHEVTWWRRDRAAAAELKNAGSLQVTDFKGTRSVPIVNTGSGIKIVDDLKAAISAANLIVVPLPSTVHEDLAPRLAPFFEDGQVVFLPPGTFGSYLFADAMKKAGNRNHVAFAETGTLPYLVRKHSATSIVISAYATRLPTGVFPARSAPHAFEILRAAYPSVEPIEDALSAALMNAGPIIHPPLILMNAGPLEHFPSWDIHAEGTQASIRRVTSALDGERIAIRKALGYAAPHFPLADHYAADGDEWMYGRGAHGKLTDSGDWREKIDLQTHRYMQEDTRLGLSFLVSCARLCGVSAPVAEGLLNLASAVCGMELYAEGRTLGRLGLANKSREQLLAMMSTGESHDD